MLFRDCSRRLTAATLLLTLASPLLPSGMLSPAVAQTAGGQSQTDQLLNPCRQDINTSQYTAAATSCQKAAESLLAIGDRLNAGRAYNSAGYAYLSLMQYPQATNLLQKAVDLAKQTKDPEGEARATLNLGSVYQAIERNQLALEHFQKGTEIARQARQRLLEVMGMSSQGVMIYKFLGKRVEGLQQIQQASDLAEQESDRPTKLHLAGLLCRAYSDVSSYDKAIEHCQKGLTLAQELKSNLAPSFQSTLEVLKKNQNSPQAQAFQLLQLGREQFSAGQFSTALYTWQQTLALYRAANNRVDETRTLFALGLAYRALGEPKKAIEHFQQALTLAKSLKNDNLITLSQESLEQTQREQNNPRQMQAATLASVAVMHQENKDSESAIRFAEQALALYQQLGDRPSQLKVLRFLVGITIQSGKVQNTIAYAQQMLTLARELKDTEAEKQAQTVLANFQANPKLMQALQLMQEAQQKVQSTQYAAALDLYQKALRLYQEAKNPDGQSRSLFVIGALYHDLGDMAKAIEYYQQALASARQARNTQIEQQIQAQITIWKNQQSNPQKAEADRLLARTRQLIGASEFEAANRTVQQALELYRAFKDPAGEARCLSLLGLLANIRGDRARADALFQQAMTIAQRLNDPELIEGIQKATATLQDVSANPRRWEAMLIQSQGIQQINASQFDAALVSLEKALVIFREVKDRKQEGATLAALAIVYRSLGNVPKGKDYYQQALTIAREIGDKQAQEQIEKLWKEVQQRSDNPHKAEAETLVLQGGEQYQKGQFGLAIASYERALKIVREINDRRLEAITLAELGRTYSMLRNMERSNNYFQQSLAISRELKDRSLESLILGHLGLGYVQTGNFAKARELLEQSRVIAIELKSPSEETSALVGLGAIAMMQKDFPTARDYYQKALKIFPSTAAASRKAVIIGLLGSVYFMQGDYGKAVELFQQKLALSRETKDRGQEADALNAIGYSLARLNKFAEAELPLRSAIQIQEALREGLRDSDKVSIFDGQQTPYLNLQWVLASLNKPEEALEIAERGRARAFVELVISRIQPAETRDPSSKTAEQLTTGEQLLTSSPRIDQIKQIAKTQNATLVAYSLLTDEYQTEDAKSRLYIWVVKPTGTVTLRQVTSPSIRQLQSTGRIDGQSTLNRSAAQNTTPMDTLITRSRRSIGVFAKEPGAGRAGDSDSKSYLRQLHKLLIEPIAQDLPKDPNQHVIFIPQGALFLVPFPALIDASGKYLIEQHTLLTAPSIQVLELTHQQRQRLGNSASGSTLIVGNPVMPKIALEPGGTPEPLAPLPGAEQEARAIAQLLKTSALLGPQATESVVVRQMQQARRIHLATHGLLDERQGLGSAIALTPTGKDDGLLTAEEILNLKLQAELVVLSACDTGRGRITGDGVVGLSRSLISAGVPSVVVSLWAVPDAPTASLMTQFYQNLQKTPDKAQALRQAMLSTMQQYPNPRNWAAFTLIGEAE